MYPSSLPIRPFARWKQLLPCADRKTCLFTVVISLWIVAGVLWLSNGYHAGFFTLNQFGSMFPDSLWASITLLGDTRVALALLLLFVYRHPLLLPAALIASLPATLITQGIKRFTEVPRPALEFGIDNINQIGDVLTVGSFPSGHSATVGVFIGLMLMLNKNAEHRRLWLWLMLLVGGGRVMVGAHYPIDVLIGLSIGLLCAYIGLQAANHFQLMRHFISQWAMLTLPFIAAYLSFTDDGGYPQGAFFEHAITSVAIITYFHHQLRVHDLYRHEIANPLKVAFYVVTALIKHQLNTVARLTVHMIKIQSITLIYLLAHCFVASIRFCQTLFLKAQNIRLAAIVMMLLAGAYKLARLVELFILRIQALRHMDRATLIQNAYLLWPLIKRFLWRTDLILFSFCFVILTSFPTIDLAISNWFYDPIQKAFTYKEQPIIYFMYKLVSQLPFILLLLLPVLAWKRYRKYRKGDIRKVRNVFLLLVLLLGPGVLVNTVLKDNSIGRARPVQIQEFAGDKTFSAAFEYSGQCSRNCSFVSGHAAMGFFFISLAWVFASRAWFYGGLSIGLIVGIGRIIQGGHFFSDVVFAFWAVYLVTCLLGHAYKMAHPLCKHNRLRVKVLKPALA